MKCPEYPEGVFDAVARLGAAINQLPDDEFEAIFRETREKVDEAGDRLEWLIKNHGGDPELVQEMVTKMEWLTGVASRMTAPKMG